MDANQLTRNLRQCSEALRVLAVAIHKGAFGSRHLKGIGVKGVDIQRLVVKKKPPQSGGLVRRGGVEPPRPYRPLGPQPSVSTNFTTFA